MQKLANAHRAQIAKVLDDARAQIRRGEVDGYDPQNGVRVKIQPEGTLTGWLPILTMWSGNEWGDYYGPNVGDQCLIAHIEGDPESGVCLGFTNNAVEVRPPVPSGESWKIHKSGSFLKFTNDGKVSLHGTVEIAVGNLGSSLYKLVTDAFVTFFNNHTHGGPKPDQTMGDPELTTILKAN